MNFIFENIAIAIKYNVMLISANFLLQGWVDNYNGPTGLLIAVSKIQCVFDFDLMPTTL
jgi:hypothetical protein